MRNLPFFAQYTFSLLPFLLAGALFGSSFVCFSADPLKYHRFSTVPCLARSSRSLSRPYLALQGTACEFRPGIDLLKVIFAVTWRTGCPLLPRFHPALLGGATFCIGGLHADVCLSYTSGGLDPLPRTNLTYLLVGVPCRRDIYSPARTPQS